MRVKNSYEKDASILTNSGSWILRSILFLIRQQANSKLDRRNVTIGRPCVHSQVGESQTPPGVLVQKKLCLELFHCEVIHWVNVCWVPPCPERLWCARHCRKRSLPLNATPVSAVMSCFFWEPDLQCLCWLLMYWHSATYPSAVLSFVTLRLRQIHVSALPTGSSLGSANRGC